MSIFEVTYVIIGSGVIVGGVLFFACVLEGMFKKSTPPLKIPACGSNCLICNVPITKPTPNSPNLCKEHYNIDLPEKSE